MLSDDLKHQAAKSVAMAIVQFFRSHFGKQRQLVEFIHKCHAKDESKDNSEELLYRLSSKDVFWVRIRVDLVTKEEGELLKNELEVQDREESANKRTSHRRNGS